MSVSLFQPQLGQSRDHGSIGRKYRSIRLHLSSDFNKQRRTYASNLGKTCSSYESIDHTFVQ